VQNIRKRFGQSWSLLVTLGKFSGRSWASVLCKRLHSSLDIFKFTQ